MIYYKTLNENQLVDLVGKCQSINVDYFTDLNFLYKLNPIDCDVFIVEMYFDKNLITVKGFSVIKKLSLVEILPKIDNINLIFGLCGKFNLSMDEKSCVLSRLSELNFKIKDYIEYIDLYKNLLKANSLEMYMLIKLIPDDINYLKDAITTEAIILDYMKIRPQYKDYFIKYIKSDYFIIKWLELFREDLECFKSRMLEMKDVYRIEEFIKIFPEYTYEIYYSLNKSKRVFLYKRNPELLENISWLEKINNYF